MGTVQPLEPKYVILESSSKRKPFHLAKKKKEEEKKWSKVSTSSWLNIPCVKCL